MPNQNIHSVKKNRYRNLKEIIGSNTIVNNQVVHKPLRQLQVSSCKPCLTMQ